jgi:hypothetical protein
MKGWVKDPMSGEGELDLEVSGIAGIAGIADIAGAGVAP